MSTFVCSLRTQEWGVEYCNSNVPIYMKDNFTFYVFVVSVFFAPVLKILHRSVLAYFFCYVIIENIINQCAQKKSMKRQSKEKSRGNFFFPLFWMKYFLDVIHRLLLQSLILHKERHSHIPYWKELKRYWCEQER